MKITNPDGLRQVPPESTFPSKKTSEGTGFNHLLQEAMTKPEIKNTAQKASALSEPHAVQSIGRPTLQTAFVDKTARVIELMDQYTKSLSDPQKTLKDIEPVLNRFIDEASTLHEAYLKTEDLDTGLITIMDDLFRAARLEGIRFQRGDYLDPD